MPIPRRSTSIRTLAAVAAILAIAAATASAATFTVNNTADAPDSSPGDGACATAGAVCTLRAAIQEANALGGTNAVNVPAGVYALTLGALAINTLPNNLTITGTGAPGTVIVDGSGLSGVFAFFSGTIALDNLVIRNGSSGTSNPGAFGVCTGGGILVGEGATVTVNTSAITHNQAPNASGGGICVAGTLALTDSTVSGNTATFGGGGIRVLFNSAVITRSTISGNQVTANGGNGGGIETQGALQVVNSTVSGNSTLNGGGSGISVDNGDGAESLTLTQSTLAGNSGDGQLGVFSGPAVVESTIIANPASGPNCVIFDNVAYTSNGHNLESASACRFTAPTDRSDTDPRLGPLADNGGPTRTHALLAGSPAIDAGAATTCPATDQRGVTRPQNASGGAASVCDIGAYEVRANAPLLLAAVLPASRSVQVGTPASAFATIINQGPGTASGCGIFPVQDVPAAFGYQTTDAATNQPTGTPNTPANVPPAASQSFVFALTSSAAIAPLDEQFTFVCANADPAPIVIGLDTLLFSASALPVPDIIALAATATGDGIANLQPAPLGPTGLAAPAAGFVGAFAVATVNVGAVGDLVTVSANTGSASLPLGFALCQTAPGTGACASAVGSTVTIQVAPNDTPTFAIFVSASDSIAFDPAASRIFVVFRGSDDVVRGSTSVAVRTQ